MTYSDDPQPPTIPEDWEHHDLYEQVLGALQVLPTYFKTSTFIEGIQATGIFTLNSALGATIESQVVTSLNLMRPVWDPNEKYQLYSFIRQSQTFPDVLFKMTGSPNSSDILFGIELKGWYLLAKEGEPSLRYKVAAAACTDADLVCVVPWALSNVLAGSPQIISPYVVSAKYAAEYRNYHWQHVRSSSADTSIRVAEDVTPYPVKSDQISDRPASDGGGNFGRFARTGVMGDYLTFARTTALCGIPAQNWLQFFSIFRDQKDPNEIKRVIDSLRVRYATQGSQEDPISLIVDQLEILLENNQGEQGCRLNGYPRQAPCLVASLSAWIAPRAAVSHLGRSPSPYLPISLSPYLPISLSPYLPISLSPHLPISLSPYLPISLSPYLPISPSPHLPISPPTPDPPPPAACR